MFETANSATFDSETTLVLGAAFEAAWDRLKASGSALADAVHAGLAREIIAKRMIERARGGERNPDRLIDDALEFLAQARTLSGRQL